MNTPIFPFFILLFAVSCQTNPDLEKEKQAILQLHEEQRVAHFEKNARRLWRDSLTDYIEVNRGQVNQPNYSDNIRKFSAYFESVDFLKWEDIRPPVISFSDDASMATTVVSKLVITRSKTPPYEIDSTHFAWLAVYKKVKGEWQLHRMGSTNR